MDKRTLLDRTGAQGEERLLLAQVLDKMENAQRRQEPECTCSVSYTHLTLPTICSV